MKARLAAIGVWATSVVLSPAIGRPQELPKTAADAAKMEAAEALPITAFYDTPTNLAATQPGALLREEAFAGYQLPTGVKAVAHPLSLEGRRRPRRRLERRRADPRRRGA